MEQAIKKAIEGGYDIEKYFGTELSEKMGSMPHDDFKAKCWLLSDPHILLDPKFWQCLGKACGWPEREYTDFKGRKVKWHIWKNHWHQFIDHLASGKDPASFFTTLISPR